MYWKDRILFFELIVSFYWIKNYVEKLVKLISNYICIYNKIVINGEKDTNKYFNIYKNHITIQVHGVVLCSELLNSL